MAKPTAFTARQLPTPSRQENSSPVLKGQRSTPCQAHEYSCPHFCRKLKHHGDTSRTHLGHIVDTSRTHLDASSVRKCQRVSESVFVRTLFSVSSNIMGTHLGHILDTFRTHLDASSVRNCQRVSESVSRTVVKWLINGQPTTEGYYQGETQARVSRMHQNEHV